MVHVPKVVYAAVYGYLFTQGSLALKETHRKEYNEDISYTNAEGKQEQVRNLYINMIMKSLCSRGFVKDTFAWRHHYYMLTDAGEEFIRKELCLGENVKPRPFMKAATQRPDALRERGDRPFRRDGDRGDRGERRDFRGSYRPRDEKN